MTVDVTVLVVVAVAGFLIGFGKAGVAGTIGPFVTVLMALVLPADDAIGLLLPMLIIGDGFSVVAHWQRWDASLLWPLLFAGVAGVGLGSVILLRIEEETLSRLIAVIMLLFIAWFAWTKRPRIPASSVLRFGWLSGVVAGITSTIAHMGGPPVVIYLMAANLSPVTLVGTTVIFFAAVNLLKVPSYVIAGVMDLNLLVHTFWAWMTIPIGVWVGRRIVGVIPKGPFESVLVLLLGVGAVMLLIR